MKIKLCRGTIENPEQVSVYIDGKLIPPENCEISYNQQTNVTEANVNKEEIYRCKRDPHSPNKPQHRF